MNVLTHGDSSLVIESTCEHKHALHEKQMTKQKAAKGLMKIATLAEWLRRRLAKPMGSPRVGSKPL